MKEYYVTCSQMKILEQNTDAAGLSYYQMMENAGRIAADRIVEITMASPINDAAYMGAETPDAAVPDDGAPAMYPYLLERPIRARVYCGKGNNGGDGFVVARLLQRLGWQVQILLVDGEPATPDAIANWKLAAELGIPMGGIGEAALGEKACAGSSGQANDDAAGPAVIDAAGPAAIAAAEPADIAAADPDVIVDAIYGTGFHGMLREAGATAAAQIAAARDAGARVFALDIPSGMGGDLTDETELDERCVKADVTITFHAKKPVHLQKFAAKYCGQIITADIGIVDPERDAVLGAPGRGDEDWEVSSRGDAGRKVSSRGEATLGAPAQKDASRRTYDPDSGEHYDFDDFVEIISRLRAPDGCPWDRAQTHETLKKYLLEETQEAAEAIDKQDDENFCEELGDVLLQIVLNAQIGKERGAFTIDDVIQGISEKMIRRHPWVFGDMHVDTPEEGEKLWEEIKKKEKEKR